MTDSKLKIRKIIRDLIQCLWLYTLYVKSSEI